MIRPTAYGFYDPNSTAVFIESNQSQMNTILAHELGHFSDHQRGFGNQVGSIIHDHNIDGKHADRALKTEMAYKGVNPVGHNYQINNYNSMALDQSSKSNKVEDRWELSPAFSLDREKANVPCMHKACEVADKVLLATAIGSAELFQLGNISLIGFGLDPWSQKIK